MSQHNIVGSEVFGPKPLTVVRMAPRRKLNRRRASVRAVALLCGGAMLGVAATAVAVAAALGPTVFG